MEVEPAAAGAAPAAGTDEAMDVDSAVQVKEGFFLWEVEFVLLTFVFLVRSPRSLPCRWRTSTRRTPTTRRWHTSKFPLKILCNFLKNKFFFFFQGMSRRSTSTSARWRRSWPSGRTT